MNLKQTSPPKFNTFLIIHTEKKLKFGASNSEMILEMQPFDGFKMPS